MVAAGALMTTRIFVGRDRLQRVRALRRSRHSRRMTRTRFQSACLPCLPEFAPKPWPAVTTRVPTIGASVVPGRQQRSLENKEQIGDLLLLVALSKRTYRSNLVFRGDELGRRNHVELVVHVDADG
jgi:hypothetical protein